MTERITMSKETIEDLNRNVLVGYTDKRGQAWHHRAGLQNGEPNHYTGPIPIEDVRSRLFNWKAEEAPLQAVVDGQPYTVEGRKAIVRSDTKATLGIFKDGYQVHQYDEWLIQNVETILDADLAIGSAGLLRGGGVAWVQIEMEDTMEVRGVEFRPYLTAATSMDGTLATTYVTGATVTVCDNTLSAALAEKDTRKFKIRHSRHSGGRVGEIRDALEIVHGVGDEFAEEIEKLVNRPLSDTQWDNFVDAYTGLTKAKEGRSTTLALKKRDTLNRLWNSDERAAPWKHTHWGAVQAVNTARHHEFTVKGDRVERNMDQMVTGKIDDSDRNILGILAQV